jgi:hypothetical protein
MALDLETTLDSLGTLPASSLKTLWLELFGHPLKIQSRRDVIVRLIAYRLQERAYGGLSASARSRLRKLAQELERSPDGELPSAQLIKPGTRLVREWKGKPHSVTVTEGGFTYDGRAYRSLSQIAREITGARWSGPAFFGLRKPPARNGVAHG